MHRCGLLRGLFLAILSSSFASNPKAEKALKDGLRLEEGASVKKAKPRIRKPSGMIPQARRHVSIVPGCVTWPAITRLRWRMATCWRACCRTTPKDARCGGIST